MRDPFLFAQNSIKIWIFIISNIVDTFKIAHKDWIVHKLHTVKSLLTLFFSEFLEYRVSH